MSDPSRKPRIFIGSSSESADLASALKKLLEEGGLFSATHWKDAFVLGRFTLERLETLVSGFDFAAFVIAPDDVLFSREEQYSAVRDNVLLEAGMFLSALGRDRCYLIYPNDFSVKLPSDIVGLTLPTWSIYERSNPPAALRDTAHVLMRDMTAKSLEKQTKADATVFYTRDELDPVFGSFRSRIAAANHELIITGNDCLTVVQGGEPSIRRALETREGLSVKVMCAAPGAPGLLDMITKIDPRFPSAKDFKMSIDTLRSLVESYENRFGDRFALKLLPILPALGFFLVDPDHGGTVKVEIYTPQPWPNESRPHFSADADARWRAYFISMFRNYWELARTPQQWDEILAERSADSPQSDGSRHR